MVLENHMKGSFIFLHHHYFLCTVAPPEGVPKGGKSRPVKETRKKKRREK